MPAKTTTMIQDRVTEYWNITLERLQTSEMALTQTLASFEELKRNHELEKISHKFRILDLTHRHLEKKVHAYDDFHGQIIQQMEKEYQRQVDRISSDVESKFQTSNLNNLQKIQELESAVAKIAQETSAFQQEHGSQLANVHQQHLQKIEGILKNLTRRYEDEKEFIMRKAEQIIWDIAGNFSAFDRCP